MIAMPSGIVALYWVKLNLPPGPNGFVIVVSCGGYSSVRTFPMICAPYGGRNHGSAWAMFVTSVEMMLKPNRSRMAVTNINIEPVLKSELKKNVKPSVATRYARQKMID